MNDRPNRKPTRLQTYDYNKAGLYFITICTKEKQCTLGYVQDPANEASLPAMRLSRTGLIVVRQIQEMSDFYPHIGIDHFAVMPNHIHLLVELKHTQDAATPANSEIPRFISTLKRFTNKHADTDLWQRSYHDHVVRNERDYLRIWQYIDSNAAKWKEDCFYLP